MEGRMYRIEGGKASIDCFETPSTAHKDPKGHSAVIYIHGLEGGFNDTIYASEIAEALEKINWFYVQVRMRSSGKAYGLHTLYDDVEDLTLLVQNLVERKFKHIILLGFRHDAVFFMKHSPLASKVSAIVLHAPVSDRLAYGMFCSNQEEMLALAKKFIDQEASMPKNAFFGPSITARRFYSFVSKDGDDEMFAPDLTDEQMKARIGHVQIPSLVVYCAADQFVPNEYAHVSVTCERLCSALGPKSRALILPHALHSMEVAPGQQEAVQQANVKKFIEHVIALARSLDQ